jgi:hypothetical protein
MAAPARKAKPETTVLAKRMLETVVGNRKQNG